jgi:hypothetical protein
MGRLLIATALTLSVTEQELDETATQIRTLRRGCPDRRKQRPRLGLIGVDDSVLGDKAGFVRGRLSNCEAKKGRAGKERKMHSAGHRRTRTVFVVEGRKRRRCTTTAKIENRIGLVNGIGVSIHHVVSCPRFRAAAFIFGERKRRMVNRKLCPARMLRVTGSCREPHVKSSLL